MRTLHEHRGDVTVPRGASRGPLPNCYPDWVPDAARDSMRRDYLARGWSENTYRLDMNVLRMLHKAGIDLRAPLRADLESFILRPASANTRRLYRSRLGTLVDGLHQQGLVPASSVDLVDSLPTPKAQQGVPRPTDPDGVRRLLTEASQEVRDMVALAVYAGMRVHEIAKVEGQHFEPVSDGYEIVIVGKGNKRRRVPARPELVAIFERRRTLGRFWNYKPETVSRKIGDEMRRLGVGGRGQRAHTLRHRFATSALTVSGDIRVVQKLLGHSSPAVTAIYAEVEDGRSRQAVLGLPDFTGAAKNKGTDHGLVEQGAA